MADYLAPALTTPVVLATGYVPPLLTTPVVLCQDAVTTVNATLTATLPAPALALTLQATGGISRSFLQATLPAVALPALTLTAVGLRLHAAYIAAPLPAPALNLALAAQGSQDIDLPDADGTRATAPHRHREHTANPAALPWTEARRTALKQAAPHTAALPLRRGWTIAAQQMLSLHRAASAPHGHALGVTARSSAEHHETQRTTRILGAGHHHALPLGYGTTTPHAEYIRRRQHLTTAQAQMLPTASALSAGHHHGIALAKRTTQRHAQAIPLPVGYWQATYQPPEQPVTQYSSPVAIRFCYNAATAAMLFGCPPATARPDIIVPVRRVYYMVHDIYVTRLSDSQQVPARQLEIALDADSHTWSCNTTLVGRDALDLVQPDIPGQPVILVAHINGYDWHIIVDQWRESRQFGSTGISATGHGLTAEINAPWVLPESGTVGSQMTLQQVFAALLPFGSGWSISWDTRAPDWIVPAGAWSWTSKTPISAIHSAAAELGLVIVPDRATRTLTVMPRYPVAPWAYDTAIPDIVIPEQAITRYERQQPAPAQANAIYIHGSDVGGVIGQVTRSGTAGDRMAATVSHPLVTHSDAARLLGTRRLAAEHQQPSWRSITMPLGGELPLAEIGQLLEIDAGVRTERAVIAGVRISATADERSTTVRQQLSLGENTDNRWARFRSLIPGSPTMLGEITVTDASTGTVTASLLGGGTIRARGAGNVGDKIYIRDGVVQGQAPSLPSYAIEV
ncbi:MAG: hypothetical protein OQL08_09215 [Gammaproteobacteria bacterium]|nr:hypothetical protein [Gammaproteobacteria bacterium]